MKPAFRFTLLMSLLVHLMVMVPLWLLSDHKKSEDIAQPTKPMEVAIIPAPQPETNKQPIKSEEKPPPPRHIEDDITKANTTNGLAQKPTNGESKAQPNEKPVDDAKASTEQVAQQQEPQVNKDEQPEVIRSNSPLLSDYLRNNQHKKESDSGKAPVNVLAAEAEERARWYNAVLKRITEQVKLVWVKPQSSQAFNKGMIEFVLNENGYLEKAWIKIPSGNIQLDQSALRAMHQVYRYDIPYDKAMFQYYQVLRFHYQGGKL